ncbi:sulfur transfer protein SirA [Pelotomaculum schinkii]|uniref:Sulfur transfer protein SirA n=1 Tax=Pelotomaculum schinkii TaxID=78350 RepID=A0A4Y7RA35_9FIRM|nr:MULTISPECIES: sulfurtransferase TusA family protein [Pelotomaculum]TEB05510.1 sulfur transfer protein SirA [Pelotomaculum schinkii]TEB14511.1 sulfur transfer protein SirA [Pelotomaculum sp. FP]
MAEKFINCRGLQCPGPIVRLFKEAQTCAAGDIMEIEATDLGFKKDIAAWCKKTKNELLSLEEENGVIKARIKKVDQS